MLPIVLSPSVVDELMKDAEAGLDLSVDLPQQTITRSNGQAVQFEVEEFRKHCLVNGLDDIGLTLQKDSQITTYEAKRAAQFPWLESAGLSGALKGSSGSSADW